MHNNNKTVYSGMALAFFVGIIVMTWWVMRLASDEQVVLPPSSSTTAASMLAAGGHRVGPTTAKVVIVEFADMQCPYCADMHPILTNLQRQHPREIAIVFKHFPLEDIHPMAIPAAIASECVAESKGESGFQEFITRIFSTQTTLDENVLQIEATRLGLTVTEYQLCRDANRFQDKINLHYQQGLSAGVEGTPGIFVNGNLVGGALTAEDLDKIIAPLLLR